LVLVEGAYDLLLGVANGDAMIVSTEVEIALVVVHILDGMAVVAVAVHKSRLTLAQSEEAYGYDGGVLPSKVRLESVQLLQLLPTLYRPEDSHMSVCITDHELLLVADGEAFEDVSACGDGISGFRGDFLVIDLLCGEGVRFLWGSVVPQRLSEK
jgi:hypothetical protein